jgi:arginine:agmatine antiporter
VVLLVFWAFTGLECANAIAAKVRNPARDLPIAALGGVLLAGTIYVLACVAVQGVIPPAELARSTAPFADVVTRLAGPIAGTLVAIFAIIKAFGTLGGWILVTVETARAGALAGYFPRFLTEADPEVTPRRGLFFSGILMSLIAVTTVAPTLAKQFNALISLTVATTMMTYGLCSIALVVLARSIAAPGRRLAAQALGLVALAFSLWVIWTWIASL